MKPSSPSGKPLSNPSDPAPALGRGLALLRLLEKEGACSLEQLARLTSWPKSSLLRLLDSLVQFGALRRDPVTLRFHTLLRLVPCTSQGDLLREAAWGMMVELAQSVGQTIELHSFHARSMPRPLSMIDRCEPEGVVVRVQARIGYERDLEEFDALTQIVLALGDLSRSSSAWRHFYWADGRQNRLAAADVKQHLASVRKTGVAVDLGVNSHGVRRYAAPIFAPGGALCAVLVAAQFVTPLCMLPDPDLRERVRLRAHDISQAAAAQLGVAARLGA